MSKNPNDNQLESDLFKDISKLATSDENDSGSFLESLTNLIESEDYEQIVGELVSDEIDDSDLISEDISDLDMVSFDEFIDDKSFNNISNDNQNSVDDLFAASDNLKKALNSDIFSKHSEESAETEIESYEDLMADQTEFSELDDIQKNIKSSDIHDNNSSSDEEMETDKVEILKDEKELTPEEALAIKKQKRKQNFMYNLIMVACIGIFLYCVGRIGVYYYQRHEYIKGMSKLQDIVGDISHEVIITPKVEVVSDIVFPDELVYATTESVPVQFNNEISDKWAKTFLTLSEANPDCVGWLQIPDTKIDYPVMYTPQQYDKYLYLDFEGNYLYRGLPFMAEGTLLNQSQNYIIYGHRMADGTAFNNLSKYLNSQWTQEHPYAYFNTAYGEGVYQVMDVVITKIFNVDDECFKYYKYTGPLSEEDFNTYVYYMGLMNQVNTGVTAVYGDQLMSLSTCFRDYDPEGRLVVVFKRIQ